MNIGIIGSGNVGGALGRGWAKAGHKVAFSSRNPESAEMKQQVELAGPNARATSPAEAASSSEVIVVATPWPATESALKALGSLSGKVLLDCTNPVNVGPSGISMEPGLSAGERVAQWAPGAKVVKIFNTIGFKVMENPVFDGKKAALPYCGDDDAAKAVARQLATDLGFDPIDAGPLTQAHLLEAFATLWISLAFRKELGLGFEFAFQLVRR